MFWRGSLVHLRGHLSRQFGGVRVDVAQVQVVAGHHEVAVHVVDHFRRTKIEISTLLSALAGIVIILKIIFTTMESVQ